LIAGSAFKICREAADALDAAERERDTAVLRYDQLRTERQLGIQESRESR
jgi:hypothetical protein